MMAKVTKRRSSSVDTTIGQRVRQLRMQLGVSQEELGKGCGVSFQQIQKYEKGINRISVSRMLEFCDVLQTTPNDILGWKSNSAAINGFDSTVFHAARDIAGFPEDVQIVMRKIASTLTPYVTKKKR